MVAEGTRERLVTLGRRLADLAPDVARAARALEDPGTPPAAALVEALAQARLDVEALRAEVTAAAAALGLPADGGEGVRGILGLLDAVEQEEQRRSVVEQARRLAVGVLDRVLAVEHRDDPGFSALGTCRDRARELRATLGAPGPLRGLGVDDLAEQTRPFSELLTMVERRDELDDEQWARLEESVEASFGRPLTIAAVRGRLVLRGAAAPAGAAAIPAAPPAARPARPAAAPEAPRVPPAALAEPAPTTAPPAAPPPPPGPPLPTSARVSASGPLILDVPTPVAATPAAPAAPAEPAAETSTEPAADETVQWLVSAWARWSGWKDTLAFADAVREELGKYPYLLSVPIRESAGHEDGMLAYGYSLLIDWVEARNRGCVARALNSLSAPGGAGGGPMGDRLYEALVREGGLEAVYPDFVREVLVNAVPDPGPWTQTRILESSAETRVFTRPTARAGESDQTSQRLTVDRQRFTDHRFGVRLPPLTARFVVLVADVRDARGVEVRVLEDDKESDAAWLHTLPMPGRADQKPETRRLATPSTLVPGVGRDCASLWIAVFNADARRERRFDLVLGLKRDVKPAARR